MFEEKQAVNTYEITRNQRENSTNKLKGYFQNSSFLAQQQELATFIKNLPIIKMDDVRSINKLIEILIKQNQMIGNKCQQNFITIKECYAKHDELLKRNRGLENEIKKLRKGLEVSSMNGRQVEKYEEQIGVLKGQLKEKDESIVKITQQAEQWDHQNQYYNGALQHLGEMLKLISERNYKKGIQKVKDFNKRSKENQMAWIDWQELEGFLRQQKKRQKYLPKIKETVEIFCGRFLKISEYVPLDQVKDQFSRQVTNLMEILDDLLMLKKKNNMLSSQSRLTMSGADYTFFQGLLDKVLKVRENDMITKEDIASQLYSVKEELNQSKNHYERYLSKVKSQYQEAIRRAQEEVAIKEQMLTFYEGEKEKNTKDTIQFKNRIIELQQTLKAERHVSKVKHEEYDALQSRLESMKVQFSIKQREIMEKWEENTKTYQYKLGQKQELLDEQQKLRKAAKQELQEKSIQFKQKQQKSEEQIKTLNKDLKNLMSQHNILTINYQNLQKKSSQQKAHLQHQLFDKMQRCQDLSRRVQKQLSQIKHLQDEVQQCEREKSLQVAYIKQVQSKSNELLSKIKFLQIKKSQEKTAKKEINAIKQVVIEEKKISREMQENYSNQKEENQRLKGMIKQMKKQLEDVYLQFNHLKMIESDREKLITQIEKSDRIKEQLCKEYECIKLELIKAEQNNKSLMIELKHYKNALSRIEALR